MPSDPDVTNTKSLLLEQAVISDARSAPNTGTVRASKSQTRATVNEVIANG